MTLFECTENTTVYCTVMYMYSTITEIEFSTCARSLKLECTQI